MTPSPPTGSCPPTPDQVPLPLGDIQGVLVRGYGRGSFPQVRYVVATVDAAGAARQLLARLVDGPDLQVSPATDWGPTRPTYRLQVALTYTGLKALGLPPASLDSFAGHKAFCAGAPARAAAAPALGDIGPSAPANWADGLGDPDRAHVLFALFAAGPDELDARSAALRAGFAGAMTEQAAFDGAPLPDETVHFGFRDGISQPTIAGLPAPHDPSLPVAPAGMFFLGYKSQWEGFQYPVPSPPELGLNGSFAAFRVLAQDVVAFDQFLAAAARQTRLSPELIAAKLVGRWRNGTPLADAPGPATPPEPAPGVDLDAFDYGPGGCYPGSPADPRGYQTPQGSHMRRAYARGDDVAGGGAYRRRILRRATPYGPPYDPTRPPDGIERGLLGLFIGASIDDQYEFIMQAWVNAGGFNDWVAVNTNDPLLGANDPATSAFNLPVPGNPGQTLRGFGRFVTTRAGLYVFFPSLTALRYIGRL